MKKKNGIYHKAYGRMKPCNRIAMVGVLAVVLCLGIVVNVKSTSMKKKDLEYKNREEALMQQLEKEETRAERLEKYRIYVQSKEYIEEVARRRLGLVKPEDLLIKPSPD